jgi:hypothetical protein
MTTWAEGWFGGFSKAKISVNPSLTGYMTGSLDFLSPLYDSERTTLFSQIGLRTMDGGARVIGNMGLGQRWFWEEWALGYNLFLDQDFTRGHMRIGAGLELWLDWLRFSTNYYRPISPWLPSKDFDGAYIQERPAEGYDARMTGFLPFYRNLSMSFAVERWNAQLVAPFGRGDILAKNPVAWTLGMGWTPAPIVTVDAQVRTVKKRSEASVGFSINYLFGVPLADQLRPDAVADLTTMDGSRHDFVSRQNEIILQYRATPGRYRVFTRKGQGKNVFVLTIFDGFGERVVGEPVSILGG